MLLAFPYTSMSFSIFCLTLKPGTASVNRALGADEYRSMRRDDDFAAFVFVIAENILVTLLLLLLLFKSSLCPHVVSFHEYENFKIILSSLGVLLADEVRTGSYLGNLKSQFKRGIKTMTYAALKILS